MRDSWWKLSSSTARDADIEDAADRGLRAVTMAAAWKAAAGPEEVDELDRAEDLAGGP